ncbi:putative nucleoside hydrolase protein [Reticulomyxa filosa]|uniref:Putative nucleoside hydrolase protein n=1 Tax=Reticulomyxa filosa TaxID=46433 RepID=X6N016_RETFI|nr:putative nucleoside hydrolase protein [Reticulomyxa filosa]|eukprot:ETO19084.1 putative nucleoside hydrolase protein [Reticulomyxa filosa]
MNLEASKPQIIFDTDPGLDDSLAMLWLFELARGGLVEIKALTAVQGNTHSFNAFRNLVHLLNLTIGESFFEKNPNHLPIQIGKYNPANGPQKFDDQFFGGDGFSGLSSKYLSDGCILTSNLEHVTLLHELSPYSEELIVQLLNKHPNELTVYFISSYDFKKKKKLMGNPFFFFFFFF